MSDQKQASVSVSCETVNNSDSSSQHQQQEIAASTTISSPEPVTVVIGNPITETLPTPISTITDTVPTLEMPASSNNNTRTFNRIELPTFQFIARGERRSSNDPPRGNWRDNLNNIFQEIFVQHARNSNNPLTQWLPERRNLLLSNNNPVNRGILQPPAPGATTPPIAAQTNNVSDSFVINVYEPITMIAPVNNTLTNDASSSTAADNNNYSTATNIDETNRQVHTHQQHVHHIHMDSNNMPNPLPNSRQDSDLNRPPNSNHFHHHHQPPPPNNPNQQNSRSNSISSNQQNDEANVQEAFNQIPEARAMMDTCARYTPLVCILILKLTYDHLDGIIHFLALLMTFSHANWVVRQEISKQNQKRVVALIRELMFIIIALAVVGFVLERKNIFLSLMFASDFGEPFTLKSLLFSVCMTDLILKLLTVLIKIVITLLPPSIVEYKGRGKIYLMTESLSQLYRSVAPIQAWLIFLFESYSGSEKIVGVILSAAYMVAKSTDLLDRIKFCKRSFIKLLQKTSYGTIPSKEQLQACGGQCPICHDNFNSPVLLECNHIFCELCVGTWFDREQTCPLCRAKIVDDPSYRDGATTFFLQLY